MARTDWGVRLQGEFDAAVWVDGWTATIAEHPSIPTDEGTMLGWFANAIMAGYDHARHDARWVETIGSAGLDETSPALIEALRRLFDEYGPAGVAVTAAHLRDAMKVDA